MKKNNLPNCIFCNTNNWKFIQFGTNTNYYQCETCFCITPPKKTKAEAKVTLIKAMVINKKDN